MLFCGVWNADATQREYTFTVISIWENTTEKSNDYFIGHQVVWFVDYDKPSQVHYDNGTIIISDDPNRFYTDLLSEEFATDFYRQGLEFHQGGFYDDNKINFGGGNKTGIHDGDDSMTLGGIYSWFDQGYFGGYVEGAIAKDSIQGYVELTNVRVIQEPIAIDIKPGSCPNSINTKSKGVLSVAILGTAEFDVTTIDPVSVRLVGVASIRSAIEDVATPYEYDIEVCDDCHELIGGDGYLDLSLKFNNQDVMTAIGTVTDGDCLMLELTGNLKEEFGGTSIAGEDVVLIRKKK